MSTQDGPEPQGEAADEVPRPSGELRCDFCGQPATSVRRVALDDDYDRLARPHRVLYACPPCSERKERERKARPRA